MPKHRICVSDFARCPTTDYVDLIVALGPIVSVEAEHDGGRLLVIVKGRDDSFKREYSVSNAFHLTVQETFEVEREFKIIGE